MVMSASILIIMCIFISFFIFLRQREHFLAALLLLELIAIFLVLLIPLLGLNMGQRSLLIILVILIIRACEARLGLAVLVYIVRLYGNDIIRSIVVRVF